MQESKTKRLMREGLLVLMILIVISIIFMSCEGESDSQKYVNEEIGFSFEYPADYKEEPVLSPAEVVRFADQNEFKIPVYTATVREKSEGVTLMDLPERIITSMVSTVPGSSGFKILEEDSEKLSDGSEAVHFQFEWVWVDGATVMESVFTAAYKGDKLIMLSGTAIRGLEYSLEEISNYCRTLKVSL